MPEKLYLADPEDFGLIQHHIQGFVARGRTRFQEYTIAEGEHFGRLLFLDGYLQSAAADEHMYHEALAQPAMLLHPAPRRVLILGGGEGATLREVLRHRGVERAVMVDIDEELVSLCSEHLAGMSAGAFFDPRAQVVFDDAFDWVTRCDARFDVILLDLTVPGEGALADRFFSAEFLTAVRTLLAPGGVGAIQSGRACPWSSGVVGGVLRTLLTPLGDARTYTPNVPSFCVDWAFTLFADRTIAFSMARVEREARALGLSYYDAETHQRMFSLPGYLRPAAPPTTGEPR